MRISNKQRRFLKEKIGGYVNDADVYIFGSRADDTKKGGDIDILILGNRKLELKEKMDIQMMFWKEFGEQKIDLVSYTHDEEDTFKKLILSDAIKL